MTLTSRSLMLVMMVQHKTSDQYLTSGNLSTRSIHRFKRYRLLKTLTKTFNILSNADMDTDTDANADVLATAIALPVRKYRRAKKVSTWTLTSCPAKAEATVNIVMSTSFRTDKSRQICVDQDQCSWSGSTQGLHCLPICQHLQDPLF